MRNNFTPFDKRKFVVYGTLMVLFVLWVTSVFYYFMSDTVEVLPHFAQQVRPAVVKSSSAATVRSGSKPHVKKAKQSGVRPKQAPVTSYQVYGERCFEVEIPEQSSLMVLENGAAQPTRALKHRNMPEQRFVSVAMPLPDRTTVHNYLAMSSASVPEEAVAAIQGRRAPIIAPPPPTPTPDDEHQLPIGDVWILLVMAGLYGGLRRPKPILPV